MENQGYEDESSVCTISREFLLNEETSKLEQSLRRFSLTQHSDAHVYEDISSDRVNSSRLPVQSYKRCATLDVGHDSVFSVSRNIPQETRGCSVGNVESLSSFHRNLTLPVRKSRDVGENATSSSVRVTGKEKTRDTIIPGVSEVSRLERESEQDQEEKRNKALENEGGKCALPSAERHSRRRKKKDCKHCKNKVIHANNRTEETADRVAKSQVSLETSVAVRLQDAAANNEITRRDKLRLGLEPIFALPNGRLPSFGASCNNKPSGKTNSVFSVSNNVNSTNQGSLKPLNYDKNDIEARLAHIGVFEDKALITPQKNRRGGMKVNSIYSQEQWNEKETPGFHNDVKELNPFQRAYSLPARTHTPSSQNRVNLRRSVRGEPPPRPALLHKHRHGWTLHFARPLNGNGCTRSIVVLLLVILILLGVGGIALYIVFEPDKLQVIQQYLKTSVGNLSIETNSSSTMTLNLDELEDATNPITLHSSMTTPLPNVIEIAEPNVENDRNEIVLNLNATRHCDDCVIGEVCVALADEEVPVCRRGPDLQDPTGCAGLCLINKQRCHRLDVDAFRCMEVEHYCLDDEWTCANTLCIPLVKHCDGHMNCYDHSDEYNCACNLETHFRCGNETSCLPVERRCDGKIDCWDATDEINCTLGHDLDWSCPLESEFTCSNGQCILKARFCDGLPDCIDGSDEPHGCQGRCNKHEFTCHNGRCITKGMKCNGIDDCGDGTDEQLCRKRFT